MAQTALRTHRDAGHGGDEEGARAGRARSAGEGGPMADPIQVSASDAPGSAGGAVGPHGAPRPAVAGEGRHRAPDLTVPCKEKRGSGGEATRMKARITEADLGSSGGAAGSSQTMWWKTSGSSMVPRSA